MKKWWTNGVKSGRTGLSSIPRALTTTISADVVSTGEDRSAAEGAIISSNSEPSISATHHFEAEAHGQLEAGFSRDAEGSALGLMSVEEEVEEPLEGDDVSISASASSSIESSSQAPTYWNTCHTCKAWREVSPEFQDSLTFTCANVHCVCVKSFLRCTVCGIAR